ncbi:MAG: thiamine-phosphate kinase [Pseudomonadota bacterium]
MNEFEVIKRFFQSPSESTGLAVGIGDDCAVLSPPPGHQLVLTTDTLLEGVHFPAKCPADKLGFRSAAAAISDIAAMGGTANWANLALSVPKIEPVWLENFVGGFSDVFGIDKTSLIGGDLTRGPLSITWHITGVVPDGQAMLRTGSDVGDDIYVTGELGSAAFAVRYLDAGEMSEALNSAYWAPLPRTNIGREIRAFASSCIDLSDGLLGDLQHILAASHVAAQLDLESIPLSAALDKLPKKEKLNLGINGGDDYELCFTAKPTHRSAIEEIAVRCNVPISKIGAIISPNEHGMIQSSCGEILTPASFDHFE